MIVLGITDEEVKKGLECCSKLGGCDECPFYSKCKNTDLYALALDLINLQQAENEKLTAEKLQVIVPLNNCGNSFMVKDAKTIRTEAIKEFAERLKEHFSDNHSPLLSSIMADKIDTLVKEMTEGQK